MSCTFQTSLTTLMKKTQMTIWAFRLITDILLSSLLIKIMTMPAALVDPVLDAPLTFRSEPRVIFPILVSGVSGFQYKTVEKNKRRLCQYLKYDGKLFMKLTLICFRSSSPFLSANSSKSFLSSGLATK